MSKLVFGGGTFLQALPQGNDIATGSISLEKISDVNLTPDTLGASQDGHILQYDNSIGAFKNIAPSNIVVTEIDGGTY
jgi:hypothetical protein